VDSKKQEILRRRSEHLSRKIEDRQVKKEAIEVLIFHLAQEQYAIELQYIKEIYPLKDMTTLSTVPPFIYGLINVRRRILTVIDLKVFFGLTKEEDAEKKVIILENEDKEFAILSQDVIGIHSIPLKSIDYSLPTLTGIRQDFLKGITTDRLVILDGKKLIDSTQIIVNETVNNL
jgi:purine-binding chemotaxis protein CheW